MPVARSSRRRRRPVPTAPRSASPTAIPRSWRGSGRNYGIDVAVDLLGLSDAAAVEMAKKCEAWGAHHVGLHIPIDDQMRGKINFDGLRKVRPQVKIPIAIAGGI